MGTAAPTADAGPPDWERIPFEVPCSRCGHPLNGSSAAQCSACGLRFAWKDVLRPEDLRCLRCGYHLLGLQRPLCPECGLEFRWSDILKAARDGPQLFEHGWPKRPIDALGRTWLLAAFQPWALWARYSIHTAVAIVPLLVFIAAQYVVFAYGWQTVARIADPLMNGLSGWLRAGTRFTYFRRFDDDFVMFIMQWHLLTFVCLQLFVLSKRRYRVRWQQILRVYAHATAFAAWGPALWCMLEVLLDATFFLPPGWQLVRVYRGMNLYGLCGRALMIAGVLSVWVNLWIGYARYLEYPRGWGGAALTLYLAYLLTRLWIVM